MLDVVVPLVTTIDARAWAELFGGLHAASARRQGKHVRDDALVRLQRARAFIEHAFDEEIDLERIAA
ncbi:MAG TPA: hypothetical protein VFG69_05275, partial [Nannocystaceae bacterium]|nr:hypothetical protein [Nannocystaceae bacterium]